MIAKHRCSNYEAWTLARSLAGYPINPDASVTEATWTILRDLAVIAPEWRKIVFSTRWPDLMSQIAQIDPHNPNVFPEPPLMLGVRPGHLIAANELKYLVAPQYALAEYAIYKNGFNAIVGPSGAGKSFVALDIAARLAVANATTVYVAAEGLHGYSGRWEAWKTHNSADSDQLYFYREAVNLMDSIALSAFIAELKAITPRMIVLDTVARCMAGGDENSTKDMGIFVESCETLRRELNCGLLLVHHTGKDGKMRGNTALFAACDSVLFLSRQDKHLTVWNSFDQGGKNKHGEEAAARHLTILPKPVLVEGIEFQSAVLVETGKVLEMPTDSLSANERIVLEALEGYEGGLHFGTLADATGLAKSTLHRNLKKLMRMGHLDMSDGDHYQITESGRDVLFR